MWVGTVAVIAAFAVLSPLALAACPAAASGCAVLRAKAAPVCTAKISCAGLAAATDRAKALFAACADTRDVTTAEVEDLLAAFGGDLGFQCCVGNALLRALDD